VQGTSTPPPLPEEDPSLPTAEVLPEVITEADAPQTDVGQVPEELAANSADHSLEAKEAPEVGSASRTDEFGLSDGQEANATQPEPPPAVAKEVSPEIPPSVAEEVAREPPQALAKEVAPGKKRKGKSSSGASLSKRSKKGDALVSKWQTVAKTLEEEEVR
jgi:hypothetical protein